MTVWRHFYEMQHGAKVAQDVYHIADHAAHITAHTAANSGHLYVDRAELMDNWHRGGHISADNSRCDPPPDDHPGFIVANRQDSVHRWARDAFREGGRSFVWQDHHSPLSSSAHQGTTPSRQLLWLALVQTTLAVAQDDDLIVNATVWPALETTLKATPRWFADHVDGAAWIRVYSHMRGFQRWYYVGESGTGERLTTPQNLTVRSGLSSEQLITAAQIAKGKVFAEDFVRGKK